jgi:sugar-specific transcriptional regulator TrmB
MKKIEDYLTQLGLSEIESKIYEGLLDYGPCTILDLSSKTGINRVTVHYNVESLKKFGLAMETRSKSRRLIVAEPPEHLKYLIEQKEEQINSLKQKFPDILNTIKLSLSNTNQSEGATVKYYEGIEGVRLVYREVLKSTQIHSFVNVDQILTVLPENSELFKLALKSNPDMQMWEVIEDSRESRENINNLSERYHYCFVPKGVSFADTDFMIFDDSVAMAHIRKESPSAIIYQSKSMAQGLRAIHNIVWKVLTSK